MNEIKIKNNKELRSVQVNVGIHILVIALYCLSFIHSIMNDHGRRQIFCVAFSFIGIVLSIIYLRAVITRYDNRNEIDNAK